MWRRGRNTLDGANGSAGEAPQLVEVEGQRGLDLADNLRLPPVGLYDRRVGFMSPSSFDYRRPDPHRAALIVRQSDRIDVFSSSIAAILLPRAIASKAPY